MTLECISGVRHFVIPQINRNFICLWCAFPVQHILLSLKLIVIQHDSRVHFLCITLCNQSQLEMTIECISGVRYFVIPQINRNFVCIWCAIPVQHMLLSLKSIVIFYDSRVHFGCKTLCQAYSSNHSQLYMTLECISGATRFVIPQIDRN